MGSSLTTVGQDRCCGQSVGDRNDRIGSSLNIVGRNRCCGQSVGDQEAPVNELQMRETAEEEQIQTVVPVSPLELTDSSRFEDFGASRLRLWDPGRIHTKDRSHTTQGQSSESMTFDAASNEQISSRMAQQPGRSRSGLANVSTDSAALDSAQSSGYRLREDAPKRFLSKFDSVRRSEVDLQDGKISKASHTFNDGVVYVGQWRGELRHGYGKQSWPDGGCYQGQWQLDKAEGKGRFQTPDGDCYCGEWSNGAQHGRGAFFWASGFSYFGQWEWSQCHGLGVEIAPNAEGEPDFRYAGYFRRGRKHSCGICTWPDGGEYAGYWHAGLITGQGLHKDCRGRSFRGQWLSSGKHGSGAFLWPDGRCYGGQYSGDEAAGYGFYRWPNGIKDIGFWVDRNFYNINKYSMDEIRSRIANHRVKLSLDDPDVDHQSDRLDHLMQYGSHTATDSMPNVTQAFRRSFLQDYVASRSRATLEDLEKLGGNPRDSTTSEPARRRSGLYQTMTEAHLFSEEGGIFSPTAWRSEAS